MVERNDKDLYVYQPPEGLCAGTVDSLRFATVLLGFVALWTFMVVFLVVQKSKPRLKVLEDSDFGKFDVSIESMLLLERSTSRGRIVARQFS